MLLDTFYVVANQRSVDDADLVGRQAVETGALPFGFTQDALESGKTVLRESLNDGEKSHGGEKENFHGGVGLYVEKAVAVLGQDELRESAAALGERVVIACFGDTSGVEHDDTI